MGLASYHQTIYHDFFGVGEERTWNYDALQFTGLLLLKKSCYLTPPEPPTNVYFDIERPSIPVKWDKPVMHDAKVVTSYSTLVADCDGTNFEVWPCT